MRTMQRGKGRREKKVMFLLLQSVALTAADGRQVDCDITPFP
jgi:hypothetical protein